VTNDDGDDAEVNGEANEEDQQGDAEHDVGHQHRQIQQCLVEALEAEPEAVDRKSGYGAEKGRDERRRRCHDQAVLDGIDELVGRFDVERRLGEPGGHSEDRAIPVERESAPDHHADRVGVERKRHDQDDRKIQKGEEQASVEGEEPSTGPTVPSFDCHGRRPA
jgi:hypothetical protein